MTEASWVRCMDGSLVNAAHVLAFHVLNDDRPEANPLSVAGNGYRRGVLVAVLPPNQTAPHSAIAEGWRHQLEPLIAWISKRLGRSAVVDVNEFIGSDEWNKSAPIGIVEPRPLRPDPGEPGL